MEFRNKITILLLLVVMCIAESSAQHYVGAKGGFGWGNSRLYPTRETKMVGGLATGGFSWKYFTSEKVVGGVEVDVLFIQQGFNFELSGANAVTKQFYERKVNSVMVPIFWQPHVYMFRQRLRIYLNAGVTFSYNMSSKFAIYYEDDKKEFSNYRFDVARDNRWGYGLCGGGGLGWAFDRWEVVAEFRYYIGYSDIMKNRNKYTVFNPDGTNIRVLGFLRSPLDKMEASVGFYYRLGKKGILSKPSPRTQLRIDEWEMRRIAEGRDPESRAEKRRNRRNGIIDAPLTDTLGYPAIIEFPDGTSIETDDFREILPDADPESIMELPLETTGDGTPIIPAIVVEDETSVAPANPFEEMLQQVSPVPLEQTIPVGNQ